MITPFKPDWNDSLGSHAAAPETACASGRPGASSAARAKRTVSDRPADAPPAAKPDTHPMNPPGKPHFMFLNRRFSPLITAAKRTVAGAAAFVVTLVACASLTLTAAPARASEPSAVTAVPSVAQDAQLLQLFESQDWPSSNNAVPDALVRGLTSSKALRAAAIEKFRTTADEDIRYAMLNFLTSVAVPEISSTAMQWASDARSGANRANGYLLLSQLPSTPERDRLVHQALFGERDPAALAAALHCLRRENVPAPALAASVVKRLHALTRHAHAPARAQALQRLAEWDRGQRHISADSLRLLSDANEDVRTAAIGATSIASLQSAPVKRQLLHMASSARETPAVRGVALMNLDRFEFSEKEYAVYEKAQKELMSK